MKKMKMSALLMLTLLSLFCLTACGSNKNNAGTGTSAAQSSQATTGANTESTGNSSGVTSGTANSTGGTSGSTSGTAGTSGAGSSDREESSPGVIEGLMDDVEDGVEDLTGNDSSRASDESKQ